MTFKAFVCLLRGHDARKQHVTYRGPVYHFRCRRCGKMATHTWEKTNAH